MPTILVVESDQVTADVLAQRLRGHGGSYEVRTAISPEEVRDALGAQPVDVALVRWNSELDRTLDVLTDGAQRPRIIVVGFRPRYHDVEGLREDVDGVVEGDAAVEKLFEAVDRALDGEGRDSGPADDPS